MSRKVVQPSQSDNQEGPLVGRGDVNSSGSTQEAWKQVDRNRQVASRKNRQCY
eukprot:CAMPEP_0196668034 /NCGR_PEP_ID=MMETSP1086-20130531/65407_1 /TAXON_ID=77921 /ORGANISM="Cyanoptyche  gloeocystis , Strain SAG4.97" /LENGTH=52 /DNA_ID=CAMNT_0042005417 /DNA_START=86 /DNA_END=244 /DNA_ORIENTATION=-